VLRLPLGRLDFDNCFICTFASAFSLFILNSPLNALTVSSLPTRYGHFKMAVFESGFPDFPHVALISSQNVDAEVVNVRIHSECMTGDVFSSIRCDCGEQLNSCLDKFGKEGGILVYLRQEGRGIGLVNKLKAYNIQDEQGLDTVEANLALGFHTDERDYAEGIEILKSLGVKKINLFTNNPDKLEAFSGKGIEVVDRLAVVVNPRAENAAYLNTKRDSLGHFLK
jgi:3,4-dihydroxy 2-butanone 4-phosphate synthase/GTP cyclohydrolase II